MRFIITIVAVLMILGLAAFGVVSAQKMSAAPSQATASDSPAALASQPASAAARRHPVNALNQVAQTSGETAAGGSAPAAAAPYGSRRRPDDPRGRTERRLRAGGARTGGPRYFGLRQTRRYGLGAHCQIDTTGGPGFGFEHFKQYDFLRDKKSY